MPRHVPNKVYDRGNYKKAQISKSLIPEKIDSAKSRT